MEPRGVDPIKLLRMISYCGDVKLNQLLGVRIFNYKQLKMTRYDNNTRKHKADKQYIYMKQK